YTAQIPSIDRAGTDVLRNCQHTSFSSSAGSAHRLSTARELIAINGAYDASIPSSVAVATVARALHCALKPNCRTQRGVTDVAEARRGCREQRLLSGRMTAVTAAEQGRNR